MIRFTTLVFLIFCTNFMSCFSLRLAHINESYVEVDIPTLGRIRGKIGKSFFTNRPIYHFLGINYAEPPSNDLRFQPPEPFKPWHNNIYDATKLRQNCPQTPSSYYPPPDPEQLDEKEDVEDCLVVNVFTPELTKEDKSLLPVLFYIHGGSFYAGSAYDFFPDFLLEEDIVLVVVQYRLGVLGFLSLDTNEIPGNLGMMDVVLALEWVQQNIEYFGGNPNKVTVAGQSAGAAATSSLLVSPMVRAGLFHQTIIQSGSVLNKWAIDDSPIETATSIAKRLKCNGTTISELTECFKRAKVDDLLKAYAKYLNEDTIKCSAGLVIQTAGKKKFLVEHPRVSYENGNFLKVPTMGGTTREEGTAFAAGFYFQNNLGKVNDSRYYNRNVTRDALMVCGYSQKDLNLLTDYMHNIYFKNKKGSSFKEMATGLVDIFGVSLLKDSVYENIRLVSQQVPTYAYSFNFYGNISKLRSSDSSWSKDYPLPGGVAHSDELGYLYPSFRSNYTNRELKMVKTMTNYWCNFVITGIPSEDWPPFTKPFGPYIRISDVSKIRQNVFDEFMVTSTEGFPKSAAENSKHTLMPIFSIIATTIYFFRFKLNYLSNIM